MDEIPNARLSMNQATVPSWSTLELLEGCARAGWRGAGLWREPLERCPAKTVARRAKSLELEITSLCRAGFFLASDIAQQGKRVEDNHRAVEEAAELNATTLVLVCGPGIGRDLPSARRRVGEELAALAEYASDYGVTLGLEPMHPTYCGDRSVVVTLTQALNLLNEHNLSGVGMVIDSYHLWWDPELESSIATVADRIVSLQLADWLAPPPHPLNGRGMLGDGTIDLRRFRELTDATGYDGAIEIEIFNPMIWEMQPAEVMTLSAERFLEQVQ